MTIQRLRMRVDPTRSGARFEADVRDHLKPIFPNTERPALWGSRDKGDLVGVPGFVFQLKAERALNIAGAIEAAKKQAKNNGGGVPVAILKRRNHPIGKAYVIMELDDWLQAIL